MVKKETNKMSTRTIKLMDCVDGTSSNNDGLKLFIEISKAFVAGDIVTLSLKDCTSISSSFLNSSFGELAEKFSMDTIKSQFRLVDFKPSQAKQIKEYLDMVRSHA